MGFLESWGNLSESNRVFFILNILNEMTMPQEIDIETKSVSNHYRCIRLLMAFILIVALAFPVRIWVPFGPFTSFSVMDVILLLGLFILLIVSLSKGAIKVGYLPITVILTLPVFFCFLSFLWTINISQTIKAALTYSEALAAFLVTVAVFDGIGSETIANLLGFFVLSIILTAFFSEIGFHGLAPQIPPDLALGSPSYRAYMLSYHARLSHPFIGLSNNLATVLAFFPILFIAYAKATQKRAFFWLFLLTTLAIVLTLSRGVILALLVMYIIYFRPRRKIYLKSLLYGVAALAIFIVLIGLYLKLNYTMEYHLLDRLSMANINIRLAAWHDVLGVLVNKPLLGYGAGVPISEVVEISLRNAHSAFISQLFYFGLPFGALIDLSILILPLLFMLWRVSDEKACLIERAVALSLMGQILIFCSQASFEGSVLRLLFYFSVAASVAFIKALERESVFTSTI